LSEEEKEKLRNVADVIKQNVMENYAEYILSLEKTHTMIYYVSHIPGLVHFIFVDRTYNRVLAPAIKPLGTIHFLQSINYLFVCLFVCLSYSK
jgi:Mn2+/Fe2+ NRAMP family transporter